ncbi:MAG: hypothetical protein VX278_06745, partial [Myxococcota bacterium]|nr:hypothetical protein [Myxococcota bacterium]
MYMRNTLYFRVLILAGMVIGVGCTGPRGALPVNPVAKTLEESTEEKKEETFRCASTPAVKGAVSTPDGSYQLDLSRLKVKASMKHKIDIDPYEDRCINNVKIVLEEDPGCVLELNLVADGHASALRIGSARFAADSYCRDWPDKLEGDYVLVSQSRLQVSPMLVKAKTKEKTCSRHDVQGDFQLSRLSGGRRNLNIQLEASGLFPSLGSTDNNLVCPGTEEERNTRFEIYTGIGGAYLNEAGNYSEVNPWDYSSPFVPLSEIGVRVGTKWFGGFEYSGFSENDMFGSNFSDFELSKWKIDVGYRFGADSKLQLPVSVGFSATIFGFYTSSFEYNIGYPIDERGLSLSLA